MWLEVTLGKGEKMRKGLPGASGGKDPSPAPSSQHLLFPPPSPLPPKRKDPGPQDPNHHRACKKSVWCWV